MTSDLVETGRELVLDNAGIFIIVSKENMQNVYPLLFFPKQTMKIAIESSQGLNFICAVCCLLN